MKIGVVIERSFDGREFTTRYVKLYKHGEFLDFTSYESGKFTCHYANVTDKGYDPTDYFIFAESAMYRDYEDKSGPHVARYSTIYHLDREFGKIYKNDLHRIPNQKWAKELNYWSRAYGIFDSRELAEKAAAEFINSNKH